MSRLSLRRRPGEWGSHGRMHVFAAVKASSKSPGGVTPDYPRTPLLGPQLVERFRSHLYLCDLGPLRKAE
jgi:hypothetical protein